MPYDPLDPYWFVDTDCPDCGAEWEAPGDSTEEECPECGLIFDPIAENYPGPD